MNRSRIGLVLVNGEWMVQQTMNVEDAREVAYALTIGDGAAAELFEAAEDAERRNHSDLS